MVWRGQGVPTTDTTRLNTYVNPVYNDPTYAVCPALPCISTCSVKLTGSSFSAYGDVCMSYRSGHSTFLVPAALPLTPPSTFALRLPNCMARLTLLAVCFIPALSAASLNSNLSPHPSPPS